MEILENINITVPAGLAVPDIAIVDANVSRRATVRIDCSDVLAVVEIASPSTRRMDELFKAGVYADAGIPHYWRLDFGDGSPTLIVGELQDGRYAETLVARAGLEAAIPHPFPVTLDPSVLTT